MRQLTKRERKLAILFAAAIFLVANLAGVGALWRKQAELAQDVADLRDRSAEAANLLAEKSTWMDRKKGMDEKQPVLKSAGEANAELMDSLTASAAQHSVTVMDRGFVEPDSAPHPYYQPIAVKLKVSGTQQAITEWLVEIQQPEKFQGIPTFSMKLDSDPSKIVCELIVARYYAPAQ